MTTSVIAWGSMPRGSGGSRICKLLLFPRFMPLARFCVLLRPAKGLHAECIWRRIAWREVLWCCDLLWRAIMYFDILPCNAL